MEIGDTIKIKPKHKKVIKSLNAEVQTAHSGFYEAMLILQSKQKRLWKTAHELYPDLEKFEAVLHPECVEFLIIARVRNRSSSLT